MDVKQEINLPAQMTSDIRLRRHELGYLELIDKPTRAELSEYYERNYFQNEAGSYRKSYSELERLVIGLRIAQRENQIYVFRGGRTPGSLLDVGCGEGFVLSHFSKLGWSVTGLDFSKAGVERMNPDHACQVQQGDVFELLDRQIESAKKYDVVWLGNVLEHVLDPVELLRSLRQLTLGNGLLLVTVPNDGNSYHEYLYQQGLIPTRWWVAIPDHISYFTADSLRRIVERTGWNCLTVHGDFPIDWFLANDVANFLTDKSRGSAAHEARLRIEYLIAQAGLDKANRFYESIAEVGLGRNLTAYLRPNS